MKRAMCMMLFSLAFIATGCQPDDKLDVVRKGLKQIVIPKGSVVQYAEVPTGTQFVPGKGLSSATATTLPTEGYVVFVDEQPKYDWAHSFQLAFIPKTSDKPTVLFRGSAIPDYSFKKPDGSTIADWKKH